MHQRTLLDGLQIPVANVGAEFSRGVLQTNASEGGTRHVRWSRPSALRRASVRQAGDRTRIGDPRRQAGAHQLVCEGQIKNNRLPLDPYTLKIRRQLQHGGSIAHPDGALCSSEHPLLNHGKSERGHMMCKTAKCTIAAACASRGGLWDARAGGVWHRHVIGRLEHQPLRGTRLDLPLGRLENRRLRPGYYMVTVTRPHQPTRTRSHDQLHERQRRLSELNCSIPH